MKVALGIRAMLLHAIWAHREADRDARLPRRFELHPGVVKDLMLQMKPEEIPFAAKNPDRFVFYGVEIVADNLASRPKMITAENVVEYL